MLIKSKLPFGILFGLKTFVSIIIIVIEILIYGLPNLGLIMSYLNNFKYNSFSSNLDCQV